MVIVTARAAWAQQPMTVPNIPTNPGAGAYGSPMSLPSLTPPDPRSNPDKRPAPMPTYSGPGPHAEATEPYFVVPDSVPATRGPLYPQFANEPYTTYEGKRYAAEARLDHSSMWVQANYIHWWVRRDVAPTLVTTTTGSPFLPFAGALGQDNTAILLTGAFGRSESSGAQSTIGFWCDPEHMQSLEFSGFWLGRTSRRYNFASDANGNPLLTQPIQVVAGGAPGENAIAVTFPTVTAGNIAVSTAMSMYGAEINVARNLCRVNGWSVDTIIGFRYLCLNDRIDIDQNFVVLPGGAGVIAFNGAPQPAGANFVINDAFATTNRFYGGQIGTRIDWACCYGFDIAVAAKIAFGGTTHQTDINGATTVTSPGGGTATASGGTLALPSNIGRYHGADFSVVPEFTFTLGYQVTPCIRLLAGYTAIEWTRVERPGNQIDRRVDISQVPSLGAVPGTVGIAPTFQAQRTNFWAQGINVGIEFKF